MAMLIEKEVWTMLWHGLVSVIRERSKEGTAGASLVGLVFLFFVFLRGERRGHEGLATQNETPSRRNRRPCG